MKRVIRGRVYSDKGDKTIVVRVVTRQTHPLYKKQFTRHRKFMAHDENNQAKAGDLVLIVESRPVSAKKHFMLDKIIERAGAGFEERDAAADVPMEEIEKKERPKAAVKPKTKIESKQAKGDAA